METKEVFVILCFLCSSFLPRLNAETIVVEELAKLNSPSIHVGDSLGTHSNCMDSFCLGLHFLP